MNAPATAVSRTSSPLRAIFVGGFIAGVLDISSAYFSWVAYGVTWQRIFQSVAAGIYGKAAREGGWKTALVGAFCHFLIAFTAATVYYLASRKLTFMTRHAVVSGLLYGICVWAFMSYVVLPLSQVGQPIPLGRWQGWVTGPLGHPFCVGLPIALSVRRFAAK
jgi:ascorbate-specific PTS system EIIC-type component UlaA